MKAAKQVIVIWKLKGKKGQKNTVSYFLATYPGLMRGRNN